MPVVPTKRILEMHTRCTDRTATIPTVGTMQKHIHSTLTRTEIDAVLIEQKHILTAFSTYASIQWYAD